MTGPGPASLDPGVLAAEALQLAELGRAGGWPPAVCDLLQLAVAARLGGDESARPTVVRPEPDLRSLVERIDRAAEGDATLPRVVIAAAHTALRLLDRHLHGDEGAGPEDARTTGPARIVVVAAGPLVAEAVPAIDDCLGRPLELGSLTLLCRCGASSVKPACDASCLRDGFDDAKDPHRVPDRRDTHVGLQATVLDNRGICQHSGLCTDRLATVFHTDGEPFVTASGGRMDEIIRAVRDCPSGALSYAVDGIEARDQVDWNHTRPPAVEVSRDGPYRITGSIELVDEAGQPVDRAEGSSTEHFALCRCGHSQNKPFCSGMHYYVEFHDPEPAGDSVPSMFEWAGGLPALTRMTRIFYERYVPADDLLAPVFARMADDHPQRVARWLGEVFGGPRLYSDTYGGYPRMLGEHLGRHLTEAQRARWVALLLRSAREAGLPNDAEFRSAFAAYLEWGSRLAVENSQSGARPPQNMPMPSWGWTTAAGPPGSRMSALNPPAQGTPADPVPSPAAGEIVSFATHVKPLFRERDRRSMLFAFDLWDHDHVRENGPAIEQRLQAGTMPCDGAWPADRVAVFARWLAEGAAP